MINYLVVEGVGRDTTVVELFWRVEGVVVHVEVCPWWGLLWEEG